MAMPHRPHVCVPMPTGSARGITPTLGGLDGFIVELTSILIYAPAEERHSQTSCEFNPHTAARIHEQRFAARPFLSPASPAAPQETLLSDNN